MTNDRDPAIARAERRFLNSVKPGSSDPDRSTIERLAALSPIDYDRQRKQAAEALGCRAETLDNAVRAARGGDGEDSGTSVLFQDIEPAGDPVDGAALLDEIHETLTTYMVMPSGASEAVTLWVLHTWTHHASRVSPLLAITSPEKRCGKSTLLALLQRMTPRALSTSNITAAALFRSVEKWSPTLLIDEADTFLKTSDELRGIVNSGHTADTAYVIRTVGEDHEPRVFSTWAPKAIALIGKLPSTLADRSITVPLRRRLASDNVQRLRVDRLDLRALQARCARWARDHATALQGADPRLQDGINDRCADNWRALAAIADQAGGHWPERLRQAIAALTDDDDDDGARITLLRDIRDIIAQRHEDRISSDALIEALTALEDRPWPEWRQGKPITKAGLARLLKPFGIRPKEVRIGERTLRGYERRQFEDAFRRYLPNQTETPKQPSVDAICSDFQSETGDEGVSLQNPPEPAPQRDCFGVSVGNPDLAGGEDAREEFEL